VGAASEKARILPVIEAIATRFPEAVLSVDTYKADVAREALEAGVHIVNDITGLRSDPEVASVAARFNASLIVMHSLGMPGEMPHEHVYTDVVVEVKQALLESVRIARTAGARDVVIDPGFGFGKTVSENLTLMGSIPTFLEVGCPVMVGVSRKSTIGTVLGTVGRPLPVTQRLFGTLGATAVAVLGGASIVRTHDVQPTVELLKVVRAIRAEAAESGYTGS
jgi:dihydropteroate synthase